MAILEQPAPGGDIRRVRPYAAYVLFILVLANTLNATDRAIINLLVEPIRKEFGFSDTQLGMVSGIGFSLFYAVLGLPIARLADRRSRKHILAAGIAVWSLMTMLTGRAIGFWTMLGARFGVGAGEATCYPCALSLIPDYFAPAQRPRAVGLYQLGLNFGFIFGAAVASIVAQRHGWRAAFYVMGVPGLVLAIVLLATVREPVRGARDPATVSAEPAPGSLAETIRALLANRPFVLLVLASASISTAAATLANWGSAYLMRSHGLSMAEVGIKIGPLLGTGGAIGTIAGGIFGTMIARRSRNPHAALIVVLFAIIPSTPFMALFLLAPTMPLVILGGVGGGVLSAMHYGPLVATAIGLVPPRGRAVAGSLLIAGQTLVGFGIGPLIVGVISDLLRSRLGDDSLRYAMLIAPLSVLVGWCLTYLAWLRLRTAGTDEAPVPVRHPRSPLTTNRN